MNKKQKILLALVLVGVLAIIILTWGSIGSAVLCLALLLGLAVLPIRWFLDTRNTDDFWTEN